jgi:hypothetical protein
VVGESVPPPVLETGRGHGKLACNTPTPSPRSGGSGGRPPDISTPDTTQDKSIWCCPECASHQKQALRGGARRRKGARAPVGGRSHLRAALILLMEAASTTAVAPPPVPAGAGSAAATDASTPAVAAGTETLAKEAQKTRWGAPGVWARAAPRGVVVAPAVLCYQGPFPVGRRALRAWRCTTAAASGVAPGFSLSDLPAFLARLPGGAAVVLLLSAAARTTTSTPTPTSAFTR